MFIYIYCFYYFEHVHFMDFFLIIKHIYFQSTCGHSPTRFPWPHVSISVANMIQLIPEDDYGSFGITLQKYL